MPKNKGKGGKNYRKGKHSGPVKRDLVTKDSDEGLEYSKVEKMLGNARVLVKCFDGVTRVGRIRGKMKRKVWIGVGDLVLVSLREFENKKCDVILKYLPEEIRQLKAQGCIPEVFSENETNTEGIEFVDNLENMSQSDDSENESSDEEGSEGEMSLQKKIEQNKN